MARHPALDLVTSERRVTRARVTDEKPRKRRADTSPNKAAALLLCNVEKAAAMRCSASLAMPAMTSVSSMACRFATARSVQASSRGCLRVPVRAVSFVGNARRSASSCVTNAVFDSGAADAEVPLTEDELTLRDVTRKLVDCRRRKAAANAVDLLVSLGRANIEPDLFAATTCLGACVASGKIDLALKVFEEVFQKGVVKPDEVVFAELIRGHLAVDPPAWPRAISLLTRMRTEHGVTPTALSYNILLAKCADDNELERAEEIVDRMADEEIVPDGATADAVKKRRSIRSYAKKMLML
jgi:pentatricopeptide repeat protein